MPSAGGTECDEPGSEDVDIVLGDSTSSDIHRTHSRGNRSQTSMLMLGDSDISQQLTILPGSAASTAGAAIRVDQGCDERPS
jgi:hypothetical protein